MPRIGLAASPAPPCGAVLPDYPDAPDQLPLRPRSPSASRLSISLCLWQGRCEMRQKRSEEHTSELQSLMRISYAVFCLKKKKYNHTTDNTFNQYEQYIIK